MNNKLQNFFLGTLIVAGIVLCAVLFASESSSKTGNGPSTKNAQSPSGSTAAIINAPTTAVDLRTELAVITYVNSDTKRLSVRTYKDEIDYTFYVQEPALIYSEYGNAMTMSQLNAGNVIDITFDAASSTVKEIHISGDVVRHLAVSDAAVNTSYRRITIYNKNYEYSRNVVVV